MWRLAEEAITWSQTQALKVGQDLEIRGGVQVLMSFQQISRRKLDSEHAFNPQACFRTLWEPVTCELRLMLISDLPCIWANFILGPCNNKTLKNRTLK